MIPRPHVRAPDRTAAVVYAAIGAWLVGWSAALATSVPTSDKARRWNLAWSGFDLAEAAAASATALLLARGERHAAQPAAVLAALLCVDAWFDVCTAPAGRGRRIAIAEAAILELPVAAASAWLSARLSAESSGGPYSGVWQTASTLLPSGSRTNAPK